jgi:hypothetical protein
MGFDAVGWLRTPYRDQSEILLLPKEINDYCMDKLYPD